MSVEVVAIQPFAIVDFLAVVDKELLIEVLGSNDNLFGSRRVDAVTLEAMLAKAGIITCTPGGSTANVCRALASGFGVQCRLLGTRGSDASGIQFLKSMERAGVDMSAFIERCAPACTGRSLILCCNGERTMRTCAEGCQRLLPEELTPVGSDVQFLLLSGYCLYGKGLLEAALHAAKQAGAKVIFDLASWDLVHQFQTVILAAIVKGSFFALIGNVDEACELARGREAGTASSACARTESKPGRMHTVGTEQRHFVDATQALATQPGRCEVCVTTLGARGCILRTAKGESLHVPALQLERNAVVDGTGAGDLFSAGFVAGLLKGCSWEECCRIGCAAGAAAVQVIGAEVSQSKWAWVHEQAGTAMKYDCQLASNP